MSQGTINIYEFLHKKMLSTFDQEKSAKDSNDFRSDPKFGKNGIEFRKCRMMLAIQNEFQLNHSKKFYPEETDNFLDDLGNSKELS